MEVLKGDILKSLKCKYRNSSKKEKNGSHQKKLGRRTRSFQMSKDLKETYTVQAIKGDAKQTSTDKNKQ